MSEVADHSDVRYLLDDLEQRLSPSVQEKVRERHISAIRGEGGGRPPVLLTVKDDPDAQAPFPVQHAVEDPEKMLLNELRGGFTPVISWLQVPDDRPLQIRPNFGIGLVASVFGARIEVVGDNPPWVHPVSEDAEHRSSGIRNALDRLDVSRCHETGWLPRVAETLDYYQQALSDYPAIRKSIAIIMPDLQGPLDTASMLWGSTLFEAIVLEPELLDELFAAVAQVMIHVHQWLRDWVGRELLPAGFSHQHGSMVGGNLLLRSDSGLMLHPRMYAQQVLQHDRTVFNGVGGGSYHSCGNWTNNMPMIMEEQQVTTLDLGLGQSVLYDIDAVSQQARSHGKHLNLVVATVEELLSGRAFARFPAGVTLHCTAPDVAAARQIVAYCAERDS
jgi:hypothetical protein